MAEETIQPDTTTSPTTDAVDTTTQQQTAPIAEAGGEVETKAEPEGDTSVLGGELKEGEEKPAEAPAGVPEKYELAMDGVQLDQQSVEDADPVLRELGLSNDQANKLVPIAKALTDRTTSNVYQSIIDAGAQQKKDWFDAFKADPDIGGAKTEETTHLAAKALDALGYPEGSEFRKVLTETGFGNHPEMIRAMRKIGEMVSEDGFIRADGAPKTDQPTESRWYGKKEG